MIQKIYTIESGCFNPYQNMGLEEYLMYQAGGGRMYSLFVAE